MSNDPEYVNKCLVTIYLLSQTNINPNLVHVAAIFQLSICCIVWVSSARLEILQQSDINNVPL